MTMRRRRAAHEDGIALVVALMATTLLLALCSALVLLTSTETKVAANDHDGAEAFYAADSAVALAVSELRGVVDWSTALSGSITSTLADGLPSGRRTLPDGDVIDLDLERPVDGSGMTWRLYAYGGLAAWMPGTSVDPRISVGVWLCGDSAGDLDTLIVRGRAYGPQHARRSVDVVIRRHVTPGLPAAEVPLERLSWGER